MSYLKVGKAVYEEIQKNNLQMEAMYGAYRYWLPKGGKGRATFIDGVMEDGLLQTTCFNEHMLPRGAGKKGFDNYICTQEQEACPICEGGDRPSLVFALTIIDHREWVDSKGKKHEHEKKLYICRKDTFALLQLKAEKQGGLAGCTFDITRLGDKSANVGTDYDFVGKFSIAQIAQGTGLKLTELQPLDYADPKVLKYFTATELRKMGFGNGSPMGSADSSVMPSSPSGSPFKSNTGGSPGGSPGTFGSKPFNPAEEL